MGGHQLGHADDAGADERDVGGDTDGGDQPDVAIWSSAVGGGTGHVAIVLSQPTSSTVRVFSQNWPVNAASRTIDIPKANLRGYLRPLV